MFRESASHRQLTAPFPGLPPGHVGDYEIAAEIARGGMGVVYRARQLSANRPVALKMIVSGELASEDLLRRFMIEAEAAGSLDHPNIVPIYEVGEWGGQPFFSMKFIEGGSLSARLADCQEGIAAQEAAGLVAKLARAVSYAHQRGILHRDIKPGNILLDPQGEPYLTDFGLARFVEKESSLTHSMAMLGTPSYMSPEQARGVKELTTSVDVYGLGAVFYELLTGKPPFAGGTPFETVRQVLEHEPRHPSTLRRGIDRDLATICLKCLNKEVSRRYGSAEALALDVERWLQQKPIEARRSTGLERTWLWCRRHPPLAVLLGVTLLTFQALLVTLTISNIRIRAAKKNTERTAEQSRRHLIQLNVAAGNRQTTEGDWFAALPWFMEALRLEEGNASREEIHRRRIATILRTAPELKQLFTHEGLVLRATLNSDASRVFTVSDDYLLRVFDTATGETSFPPIAHPGGLNDAWFTANDRRVLTFGRDNSFRVWNAQTGAPVGEPIQLTPGQIGGWVRSSDSKWLAAPESGGVRLLDETSLTVTRIALTNSVTARSFIRFGRDNRSLAVWDPTGQLRFWDLVSHRPTNSTITLETGPGNLTIDRSGRRLATIVRPRTNSEIFHVQVWNRSSGLPATPPMIHPSAVYFASFRADGEVLATACWDGMARVWNATNGQLVASLAHGNALNAVGFTTDGTRLSTATWDGCIRFWNPDSGQMVLPVIRHSGFGAWASFGPGGSNFVTFARDPTARLWRLPAPRPARLTLRPGYEVRRVRFSPDGRLILTSGSETANLWDRATGRLVHKLTHPGWINDSCFSPDGRRLLTGSENGTVRIWDVLTGEAIVPAAHHSKKIQQVVFSMDGSRFATASFDGSALVWNTSDGSLITPSLQHGGEVNCVAFSPDGRQIATGGKDQAVHLWDARSGASLGKPLVSRGEVNSLQFRPDGRRLLSACGDRNVQPLAAHLWNLENDPPTDLPLPHMDGVMAAEFSPDGRLIATSGEDNRAQIWDATTGQRLTPALRHKAFVYRSFFSPDARLLLTVSEDSTAMVWDTTTGEPVTPPLKHEARVLFGGWSPDGREVITSSWDQTVSVWDVSPTALSIAELQAMSEVLSAHRLQTGVGLLPLAAREMKTRWDMLSHANHP